jgi:DNA/RNA endonuclease G (NUC1)
MTCLKHSPLAGSKADQDPHALAFEMPQDIPMGHRQQDLVRYLFSVDEVEKDTGITFFSDLARTEKSKLEQERATRLW